MLSVFGVDVLDPAVSLRRVHTLINRLPPGSMPAADSPAAWSNEAQLLAYLCDRVSELTWVTLKAHGAKNARMPKPIPRPGAAAQRRSSGHAGRKVPLSQLGAALRGLGGGVVG